MNAYFNGLRRYFDFSGRSTRTQYWVFVLVLIAIGVIGVVIDFQIDPAALQAGRPGPAGALIGLFHFVPSLALTVRRMHDISRTGWWLLIALVPILGAIVLVVFACTASKPGPNRFGPYPLSDEPVAAPPIKPAATVAVQSPAPTEAPIEQLEKLAALRASGAIDDAEFQRMKAKVLGRPV